AAAGGAVLALCRSLGPYFVVAHVVVFVVIAGRHRAWAIARAKPWRTVVTAAVVGAAVAANVIWGVLVQPKPDVDVGATPDYAARTIREVPRIYREAVSTFGW